MQRKKIFDSFKHWNVAILSVLMSFCMTAAFAQSGAVKGKVLDELGEPIIGANIVEKGTTNGTITDIDGNYTLSVNDLKKAILQVSFIGYNSVEEAVKGRSAVDVKLGASVVNLGEVVAIGYGTQTRREITGSVANISEENFNKGVNRDASDLLQGKVAGLTITSGSGDVTRSSQIQLRGTSTLQNDQGPMIVIDGVPGGDMSTVSPSDIESISVLKDASSAAIYGSRAAGGVILITTKRGSGSRTQINYDGYLTASTIANKPDMLNASEWRAANKALGKDISTYDKYNSDTDWFDEMTRVGVSQQHALSLSGGSSKSNYRASYTFLDRNGVARDNYMTRHSFRFQFQQRAINDRLRIGLTGAATLTDMQMPFSDDYILAYNMLPVYPVYNADGSYFTDANHNYDQGNPVQNQDQNYKKAANNYFYGQGDVQFSILDGLTQILTAGSINNRTFLCKQFLRYFGLLILVTSAKFRRQFQQVLSLLHISHKKDGIRPVFGLFRIQVSESLRAYVILRIKEIETVSVHLAGHPVRKPVRFRLQKADDAGLCHQLTIYTHTGTKAPYHFHKAVIFPFIGREGFQRTGRKNPLNLVDIHLVKVYS